MNKGTRIAGIGLVGMLAFAGCATSGGTESTEAPAPTEAPATTEAPAPDPEPVSQDEEYLLGLAVYAPTVYMETPDDQLIGVAHEACTVIDAEGAPAYVLEAATVADAEGVTPEIFAEFLLAIGWGLEVYCPQHVDPYVAAIEAYAR